MDVLKDMVVYYNIKIGGDMIGIAHSKEEQERTGEKVGVAMVPAERVPVLLVGDKTYVPYTHIDYMLNRGLGIRNHQRIFDFMFTVNGETPTAFISQGFVWPCEGEISYRFGERENPATKEKIKHNGTDIAAVEGADVNSAITGMVTETGYNAERGYFIIIERDNIQTVYSGLTQDIQVNDGDEVLRGQIIGKVGKTGKSTGAHLHFEVLINGEYYDPELIA